MRRRGDHQTKTFRGEEVSRSETPRRAICPHVGTKAVAQEAQIRRRSSLGRGRCSALRAPSAVQGKTKDASVPPRWPSLCGGAEQRASPLRRTQAVATIALSSSRQYATACVCVAGVGAAYASAAADLASVCPLEKGPGARRPSKNAPSSAQRWLICDRTFEPRAVDPTTSAGAAVLLAGVYKD